MATCPEVTIQTILGSECIGDSLPKINGNFSALQTAVCDLVSGASSGTVTNVTGISPLGVINNTTTPVVSLTGVVPSNLGGAGLVTGLLKANGSGVVSAAVAGTDYLTSATLGSSPTSAKAWVIFNGTLAGPITPSAAYNVSTITKNGTGDYTLNFINAMPNTNYIILGELGRLTANSGTDGRDKFAISYDSNGTSPVLKTTSQVRCQCVSTGTPYNAYDLMAIVFSS